MSHRNGLLPLPLILSLCAPVGLLGCPTPSDDDDSADASDDDASDDDDDASDDDAGDDDGSDDDAGDDDADDSTCDDGASAATELHFRVVDTDMAALAGTSWAIFDLEPSTGALDGTAVASGTTGGDGAIDVTLDCADGWMMLETAHPSSLTLHNYFQVLPLPDWPMIAMGNGLADMAIGLFLPSDGEGVLAVYKTGTGGTEDCQGEDSLTVDGGADLIPGGATDDVGMWLYPGALGTEMNQIWLTDADVPDHGAVATLRYHDASEGRDTEIRAPVWSWDASPSPDGAHHMTVWYVVDL